MANLKAKGFVDKNGNKVQMEPAPHEHTIAEVDGLQTALNGKADTSHEHNNIGGQFPHDGTATMALFGVSVKDNNKAEAVLVLKDDIKAAGAPKIIKVNTDNAANLQRALTNPDATPTNGSDNLITSNAVYEALAALEARVAALEGNSSSQS